MAHGGGGVGQVVGHDLVGVDARRAGAHGGAGPVDQTLGQVDRVGGAVEVGARVDRHGARPYWLCNAAILRGRRRPAAGDR